jgi:hypothetical protein
MFRNYVNESLDLNQYNQLMKKSPENQKYCNRIFDIFKRRIFDRDSSIKKI